MKVLRVPLLLAMAAGVLCCPLPVQGTTFTDMNAPIVGVGRGSLAWGDYDRDGDVDLVVAGSCHGPGACTKIYRNDDGMLVDIGAALPGLYSGCCLAWGDYDHDGDLDLAIAGDTGQRIARIYRNDYGQFVDIRAGLAGVEGCSIAWGDYDGDGDLDLVVAGATAIRNQRLVDPATRLYRNDGGNFREVEVGLPAVMSCSLAWGDYDNDHDLDLFVAGNTGAGAITRIYRNEGDKFIEIDAGLQGVMRCSLALGDYDNDGRLDLALAGYTGTDVGPLNTPVYVTKIYHNVDDRFTDIGADLDSFHECSLVWGDYDGDGDLDLAAAGYGKGSATCSIKIYRNDHLGFGGARKFTDTEAALTGMRGCSLAWGDYDNDGDLDLAVVGRAFLGKVDRRGDQVWDWAAKIYRNDG